MNPTNAKPSTRITNPKLGMSSQLSNFVNMNDDAHISAVLEDMEYSSRNYDLSIAVIMRRQQSGGKLRVISEHRQ